MASRATARVAAGMLVADGSKALRMGALLGGCAVVGLALVVAGCGRTGVRDRSPAVEMKVTTDAGMDASRPAPLDARVDEPPPCVPVEESCNGRDDDCDGLTDEVAAVPCPGGGSSYCVAGRFTDCPRRCQVCVPGAERVCFITYCTYWGVQTCAGDGRSFGPCRELRAPRVCLSIAHDRHDSPELEQCCIDNDYCCVDTFDLDGDGDRVESVGACEDVLCGG